MLKYQGKEFRNLEEQVQKNLDDIQGLKMGIKIEKSITPAQLPAYTVSSYLGQYFLVTDNNEKHLYLIVLNNEDSVIAEDLGEYPARGPQGIQGIQGPKGEPGESIRGPQGIQGEQGIRGRPGETWADMNGIDATPYTPTFTEQANDIKVETSANVITNSETPDEEIKVIELKFEVPKPDLSGYVPTSRTIAGLDLSQNITESELIDALPGLQAELTAGNGISIFNNTIAVTNKGGTFSVLSTDWSNGSVTKQITGLGANDKIDIGALTYADQEKINEAQLFVTATTGSITITAQTTPSTDIAFQYFITKGVE